MRAIIVRAPGGPGALELTDTAPPDPGPGQVRIWVTAAAVNPVDAAKVIGLRDGATLLVTGAAGAVGGYAVELAAHRGLRVVATASATDENLVRGFGAEMFVPRGAHVGDAVRALVPGGVDGAVGAALLSAVKGRLTPRVAGALPLTEASKAHERLETETLRGRLVLTP
ncbi:hypothetical protein GWI34_15345 [Actinomadura sp. DSM 109109]|nr:hypothetical protein [Actinomadura lepetitiana]